MLTSSLSLGELEQTLFRKYCQGQKLQFILKILVQYSGVNRGLVKLADKFRAVFCSGKSGLSTPEAIRTGFVGKSRAAQSKLTWAETIVLLAPVLKEKGFETHATPIKESSLKFYSSFVRYGQTYAIASETLRNSRIIVGHNVPGDWAAAEIQHIVEYSPHSSVDHDGQGSSDCIFLIVKYFEDLNDSDAAKDPYRRFPYAGGRVYYDELGGKSCVILLDSLLCHFARTPSVLPELVERPHIHVLPLDKVCQLIATT